MTTFIAYAMADIPGETWGLGIPVTFQAHEPLHADIKKCAEKLAKLTLQDWLRESQRVGTNITVTVYRKPTK